MLRPKITPSATAPIRSAIAARAPTTMSSALRSDWVTRSRFEIGDVRVAPTASPTTSGTCEPPGPSKCAAPALSAGKCDRTASTSYAMTRP